MVRITGSSKAIFNLGIAEEEDSTVLIYPKYSMSHYVVSVVIELTTSDK